MRVVGGVVFTVAALVLVAALRLMEGPVDLDFLKGMFLPTSVTIEGPTIEADITREGGMLRRVFTNSDANSQGEALVLLIEQLMAEPNYHSLIGQLDMILIEHANVTIRDVKTGLTWTAPGARARLKRDAAGVSI